MAVSSESLAELSESSKYCGLCLRQCGHSSGLLEDPSLDSKDSMSESKSMSEDAKELKLNDGGCLRRPRRGRGDEYPSNVVGIHVLQLTG